MRQTNLRIPSRVDARRSFRGKQLHHILAIKQALTSLKWC
jgi:hypothetical protein